MSGVLQGVRGPIEVAAVDRVLPHEHLLTDFSTVTGDRNHILNNPAVAIHELELMCEQVPPEPGRQHVIVEVTLPDFGRDPDGLARIADATGVGVVMGTGWYRQPFYPAHIDRTPTQVLAEAMIAEIEDGVPLRDGSRAKAGIIGEIGTDGGSVTAAEERVLRAAGRACRATGVALSTHTFFHPTGLEQLDILGDEDVDLRRVAVGHVDTFLDPQYLREIARRGAYLQFDTCGRTHLVPDERRVEALLALLADGFEDQILLSSDRCHQSDMSINGGAGYAWTLAGFADLLRAAGVGEDTLRTLTRTNPLRFLTGG